MECRRFFGGSPFDCYVPAIAKCYSEGYVLVCYYHGKEEWVLPTSLRPLQLTSKAKEADKEKESEFSTGEHCEVRPLVYENVHEHVREYT